MTPACLRISALLQSLGMGLLAWSLLSRVKRKLTKARI